MRVRASSSGSRRPRPAGPFAFLAVLLGGLAGGCQGEPQRPAFPPDSVLRRELGLTDADEVHRVSITGGSTEGLEPAELVVSPGAWVEFVTTDWRVHQLRFERDSLDAARLTFLVESDQVESPPLIERDARFVVSFADAPEGRYPYLVEGNGGSGRGVVVVLANR